MNENHSYSLFPAREVNLQPFQVHRKKKRDETAIPSDETQRAVLGTKAVDR